MTSLHLRYEPTLNAVVVDASLRVGGNLAVAGATTLGATLDAGGNQIRDVAPPTAPDDAATKAYVDAIAPGAAAPPNTSIQYNDGGAFGGDPNLTWDAPNQVLTVDGASPRMLVGSGPADPGAALQLKTNAGTGAIMLGPAAPTPASLRVQSRVATTGGASAAAQTLQLTDRTAAYVEATLLGVVTAGPLGQVNICRLRFAASRFDAGPGTVVGAVTLDFVETPTAGAGVAAAVAGTDVQLVVTGAAGATIVWDATTAVTVSAGW